jgi:hypothetical protein
MRRRDLESKKRLGKKVWAVWLDANDDLHVYSGKIVHLCYYGWVRIKCRGGPGGFWASDLFPTPRAAYLAAAKRSEKLLEEKRVELRKQEAQHSEVLSGMLRKEP